MNNKCINTISPDMLEYIDFVNDDMITKLMKLKTIPPVLTIYGIQKWLRKYHNIHITIFNSASGYMYEVSKADNGTTLLMWNYSGPNDAFKWDSYEEAVNAAILSIIDNKLIK